MAMTIGVACLACRMNSKRDNSQSRAVGAVSLFCVATSLIIMSLVMKSVTWHMFLIAIIVCPLSLYFWWDTKSILDGNHKRW
jgi:cobalamin biosynthesis protein CobD/CbiB